jgi:hypothetical protein
VNFQVIGQASGAICNYFISLSAGQSGNFSQRKLSESTNELIYNVYVNSGKNNVLKAPPIATSNEVINGSFPLIPGLNQTNSHNFYWTIHALQIVPARAIRYMDTGLTLSLYSGLPLMNPTLVTTRTITFQSRVENSVDLSIVDTGAPFNIEDTTQLVNFGMFESGEQRSFDILVRSNSGYKVTIGSSNHQTLAHENINVIDTISYNVILNGGNLDLTTGEAVQALSGSGTTSITGIAFPITILIGNLSGQEAAGTYSDILNIDVSAN